MMRFKAVSHRFIFWILGASASLFVLISYYEYSTAEEFLLQQIKTKTVLAEAEMINRIDSLLHNVRDSVLTAATVIPMEYANEEQIKGILRTLVGQHKDIYGMSVALEPEWLGAAGRGFAPYYFHQNETIAYADLSKDSYSYRTKDWYQKTVKKGVPLWSEPYVDTDGGGESMVTYSVPVYTGPSSGRQLMGVVTADITLERLADMVSNLGIGESGFAYIVSREGNVITHSNPDLVMTNIKDLEPVAEAKEKVKKMLNNMLAGNSDKIVIPCRSALDEKEQCWVSYRPIDISGWSIAIAVPMAELNSSLLQYRDNSVIITLSGLLLLTVVVVFLSRRLTVPLLSLTQSSQALARGELDTIIHDFDLDDEVGTLARQFQKMQVALKDYIDQLQRETIQRERIEGEINAAHKIQMQLLPDHGESNVVQEYWQLSALLQPAKSVGGDFYYYQLIAPDTLFFAIGDVSDKGVSAALFMAKTQTLLRQLCATTDSLASLLALINQQLYQDNESCMFVTLLCGQLNTATGELLLASAGHSAPILKTDVSCVVELEGGPALGFYNDAEFIVSHHTLPLNGVLILTTDGIDEAANPENQHYGEQRLKQRITTAHGMNNKDLLEYLLADVIEFREYAEQSDDLAMMAISRHS